MEAAGFSRGDAIKGDSQSLLMRWRIGERRRRCISSGRHQHGQRPIGCSDRLLTRWRDQNAENQNEVQAERKYERRSKQPLIMAGQKSGERFQDFTFSISCALRLSNSCPAMSSPDSASISRRQVGLVTLISVRWSPITSRPTKYSPRSFRVGPT